MNEDRPLSVAIEYARDRYNEEQARATLLEQKAARLLTALTVAITGFTLGAQAIWGSSAGQMGALEWSVRVFLVLTFLALAAGWKNVLDVVKPTLLSVASKNPSALNYVKENKPPERDEFIFDCYRDTLEKLANEMKGKERSLTRSYNCILGAGGFLLVFLVLASIEKWAIK